MKKALFAMTAAAIVLASCSNEDMPAPTNSDGNVTFSVTLPAALQSRADYGDGSQTKKLSYAVYESGSDEALFATGVTGSPEPTTIDATNFSLSLNLVKGKSYDFIFWADAAESSPYTFSYTDKTVSVSYDGVLNNDETRDAFFQSVTGLAVSGPMQQSVELRRPFAQLNVGTSDIAAAAAAKTEVATVAVSVKGVYSKLNLLTGIASDAIDDLTFGAAAIPADKSFTIDGTSYDYLAMNYLLTGSVLETEGDVQNAQRELMDASVLIAFTDGQSATVEVPNMPVQRNYRTNVYGALLTSPLDLTITVKPQFFNETDIEVGAKKPETDAEGNILLTSPGEMEYIRQRISSGDDYNGQTIVLQKDIDFSDYKWTSLANNLKNKFAGTFDGADKKISGLTAPLFGYLGDATVKNLTIEISKGAAGVASQTRGNTTLSGITVNGTISGYGSGGLVYSAYEGTLNVEDCINNAEVTDKGYCAGGMIGRADIPVTIKNSTNNGKIISNRSSKGKAAGFIGLPSKAVTIEGCHNNGDIEVNTSRTAAAAGFVAWNNQGVTITDCTNKGNIKLTVRNMSEVSVIGGIYGGSGWDNEPKIFTNCVNTGNITAIVESLKIPDGKNSYEYNYGIYAGGIMGHACYNATEITGCSVSGNITCSTAGEAPQSQYIGGLTGGQGWNTGITITDNTIDATLSGNQGEYSYINALTYNITKTTPSADKVVISSNTNNTAYTEYSTGSY